jgi:RNA polymerase sigma-70 factor (ECF subfamily)
MKIDEPMPSGIEADSAREEFTPFYRREFFAIVSIASSIAGDMSAGEDIAQEAFHRASERWDSIAAFDKPGTWVRRVAINLALNRKRKLAREAAALLKLAPSQQVALPAESDFEVWAAVAKLPRRQRAAIALFYQDDCSAAQIAEILDCAESTARQHLFKARRSLAQLLGESSPDLAETDLTESRKETT